jgi:two-component system sensor histidine kinase ChvG
MLTKPEHIDVEASGEDQPRAASLLARLRSFGHGLALRTSSSLTRRIVVLNLAGLLALLLGFLYLNQFRQTLIEARVQSLLTQGEIIAGAIAASATVEPDTITIDPDRLLQMQAGETSGLGEDGLSPLEFSINPERVAPLLRRLVTPTRTRARIYDREGSLLLDSRNLYSRGDVLRYELPPLRRDDTAVERTWNAFLKRLGLRGQNQPPEEAGPPDGRSLPEVQQALAGTRASVVRLNDNRETIVSVAVPVQRFQAVRGVLLLSTLGGDIDAIIKSERFALLQVFLIAAGVMVVLSVLLAGAIVGPVRRLAEAAERVRSGKSRQEIPDFTSRSDEIGHLSGALRDMTRALYNRIEAIERFAADVAHELKNPLTSLRSAVETLPLAKSDDSRKRLTAIIQHDVRRLDRLISDISDASRLDAELARADAERVDVKKLVQTVVSVANERRHEHDPYIRLTLNPSFQGGPDCFVAGHDSRLGQVVNNLIDNARSFSPPDREIRVTLRRNKKAVEIVVEDDGPGIPPHALERVFERFYTDRPDQGFGQNSGLGLSISRQIVEAHGGRIRAENRLGPPAEDGEPTRLGARFVVSLSVIA